MSHVFPIFSEQMNLIVISVPPHNLETLVSQWTRAFQMFPGLKCDEAGFPAFWYTPCTQLRFPLFHSQGVSSEFIINIREQKNKYEEEMDNMTKKTHLI